MNTQAMLSDTYNEVAEELLRRAEPREVAQHLYGFDPQMARRLAFFRWLYQTGRLSDG